MKRWSLVLVVLLVCCLLAGCAKKGEERGEASSGESGRMGSKSVDAVFVRKKADANARSAGRMAKMAESAYYASHMRYTSDLGELESIYGGITEDAGVTFIWGRADDQTFTFTTMHANGSKTFVFSE